MKDLFQALCDGRLDDVETISEKSYPFTPVTKYRKSFSMKDRLDTFMRDGFVDRYSGEQLVHPGALRLLNDLLPHRFPFDPHGKLDRCHDIYWTKLASIDHLKPLSREGEDIAENRMTTSMKRNQIKNLWLLEELEWTLHDPGDLNDWDGCSSYFVKLVERYENRCSKYVMTWYRATKNYI